MDVNDFYSGKTIIYESGQLKRILTPEGYLTSSLTLVTEPGVLGYPDGEGPVDMKDVMAETLPELDLYGDEERNIIIPANAGGQLNKVSTFKHHYFVNGYLGNVRAVLTWDNSANYTVTQRNDYYAWGLPTSSSLNPEAQPYKREGKEYDEMHGLNMYDHHSRFFNPVLPVTPTMDWHAENYYNISPYAQFGNNSVMFMDPDGMDLFDRNGKYLSDYGGDDIYVLDLEGNPTLSLSDFFNQAYILSITGLFQTIHLFNSGGIGSVINIFNYYGSSVGIVGSIFFGLDETKGVLAFYRFITDSVYINTFSGINPVLNNKWNLINALYHERVHQRNKDNGVQGEAHFRVYLEGVQHSSFANTTPEFQRGLLKSMKDELLSEKYRSDDYYNERVNEVNNSLLNSQYYWVLSFPFGYPHIDIKSDPRKR